MSTASARRQHSWIDSSVQGALIRRLFLHWGLFVINFVLLRTFLQIVSDPALPLMQHAEAIIHGQLPLVFILVLMLPLFVIDTIALSNRFVGPVWKLRSALKALKNGEPVQPVFFRKGDYWAEIAADFNAVLARYGEIAQPGSAQNTASDVDESESAKPPQPASVR